MNSDQLSFLLNTYITTLKVWFSNRKRYNNISVWIKLYDIHNPKNIADLNYINNNFIITIYKYSFLNCYTSRAFGLPFDIFFITTIVHELTHYNQCIKLYNGDFKKYKKEYNKNNVDDNIFEKDAMYKEKRIMTSLLDKRCYKRKVSTTH